MAYPFETPRPAGEATEMKRPDFVELIESIKSNLDVLSKNRESVFRIAQNLRFDPPSPQPLQDSKKNPTQLEKDMNGELILISVRLNEENNALNEYICKIRSLIGS